MGQNVKLKSAVEIATTDKNYINGAFAEPTPKKIPSHVPSWNQGSTVQLSKICKHRLPSIPSQFCNKRILTKFKI